MWTGTELDAHPNIPPDGNGFTKPLHHLVRIPPE